jgi:ketosteroid isomerase-like protein
MNTKEQKQIIERFIRAYNDLNVDEMVALMHPDCSFQNISGREITGRTTGLAEFRDLAERSKALFSSRRQKAVRYEFEGEKVTVDIAFEGVLRADLPNGMKAGDVLKLEGRSLYEFQDGLIYRLTDYS